MDWSPFQQCELRVYRAGRLIASINTSSQTTIEVEAQDIGLTLQGRAS
jgi:hypothetical protein